MGFIQPCGVVRFEWISRSVTNTGCLAQELLYVDPEEKKESVDANLSP